MDYNVDYFIKKFEAIPEEKWTCDIQQDSKGSRCALGHCMPKKELAKGYMGSGYGNETKQGRALNALFLKNSIYHFNYDGSQEMYPGVACVNNGVHPQYQQPTPKQRILAALYDIKKMQQPEYKDLTKELAVLPVEETSDKVTVHAPHKDYKAERW